MGQTLKPCSCVMHTLKDHMMAVDGDNDKDFVPGVTPIHMLVCALDYKGTRKELTCTLDGDNIIALARQCGITDITYIKDLQCTKEGVLQAIQAVGAKCSPGEFFVFFYAGHGANMPDDNGDEGDGKDEALCTVTTAGDIDFDSLLRDDDFAACVTASVPKDTCILIMCDCCHSGTIGDFDNSRLWDGHYAVSMSGCKDFQEAGDTGKGGIWTHSMMLAVQALQGGPPYSCAQLYNMQLKHDDEVFRMNQDIQMHWTDDLGGPENLAWPLIPQGPYTAPWNRMTQQQRGLRLSK